MGTSSPVTPLDFCPSAEEADAKARAQACPTDAGGSAPKKPKLKHEHLSKQVDQLSRTRTELQKEAAEIRKQLEALREKNSELMELRVKLEKDGKHHSQQETDQHLLHGKGCLDLLPTVPVRPVDAHPQAPQQQQLHQHAWPQHWVNNHVVFHQVAPGFSIHPSPPVAAAAAEGSQGWRWAGAPAWRVNGDGSVSLAGKVPDLNSNADVEFALDSQQQHQQQQQQQQPQQTQQPQGNYYQQQQQQQLEQRRSSPDEQRAARKKRIEMIQRRRNAAGAAGSGASIKVAGFR